MAITQIVTQSPVGETLYSDSNIGNTADAIKASSATLLYVTINNSANVQPSYVKLFNLAGASVVVGTTAPDEVVYVPGGATVFQVYQTAATPGKIFGTAFSACCVTAGGTGGVSSPSSPVYATFAYL